MNIEKFESKLFEHQSRGKFLLEANPQTENDYTKFLNNYNAWVNDCFNLFAQHLPEPFARYFGEAFKQKNNGFVINIPSKVQDIDEKRRKIHSDIRDKISKLQNYLEMIKISDVIVNPDIVEEEKRSSFTIKQKELLILYKLYQYGDYKNHDVNYILWSNGVSKVEYLEVTGMVESLNIRGYIKAIPTAGSSIMASITSEGRKAIEELLSEAPKTKKASTESQGNISPTKEDIDLINERLDEVIALLKRNEMGSEIIFNELGELREAGNNLNIKNWKQLVKGKLFDLAVEKVTGLGVAALQEMLKTLTGEDPSKLLK